MPKETGHQRKLLKPTCIEEEARYDRPRTSTHNTNHTRFIVWENEGSLIRAASPTSIGPETRTDRKNENSSQWSLTTFH